MQKKGEKNAFQIVNKNKNYIIEGLTFVNPHDIIKE